MKLSSLLAICAIAATGLTGCVVKKDGSVLSRGEYAEEEYRNQLGNNEVRLGHQHDNSEYHYHSIDEIDLNTLSSEERRKLQALSDKHSAHNHRDNTNYSKLSLRPRITLGGRPYIFSRYLWDYPYSHRGYYGNYYGTSFHPFGRYNRYNHYNRYNGHYHFNSGHKYGGGKKHHKRKSYKKREGLLSQTVKKLNAN